MQDIDTQTPATFIYDDLKCGVHMLAGACRSSVSVYRHGWFDMIVIVICVCLLFILFCLGGGVCAAFTPLFTNITSSCPSFVSVVASVTSSPFFIRQDPTMLPQIMRFGTLVRWLKVILINMYTYVDVFQIRHTRHRGIRGS